MPAFLLLVLVFGLVQGHEEGQGPGTGSEGEADENGEDDPLVSPAESGEGVRGANGIAVAPLAKDTSAGVFTDGVIADELDGTVGDEARDDAACEGVGETPGGPARTREDAVVGGRVTGSEAAKGAEEIGDGASAGGEDGSQGEEDEAEEDGGRESGGERLEETADERWEMVVGLAELEASGSGFAGLAFFETAALGFGETLALTG